MASAVRASLILDAIVTRLSDISTSNTYKGGNNYLTDVVTVARGHKMPNDVDAEERPALYVATSGPIRRQRLPLGRLRKEMTVAIMGYVATFTDDDAALEDNIMNLRADVEAAIDEDRRLGETCVICYPEEDDGSTFQPPGTRSDGYFVFMLTVLWFESKTSK